MYLLSALEHAHLSILCEIRALLHYQIGMTNDEIANIFESWNKSGPLRGNFLVGIGHKGLRFKEGDGIEDERGIVEGIEDKVTQDVDKSEGTGTWSTKVRSPPLTVPLQDSKAHRVGDRRATCGRSSYCSSTSAANHLGEQAGTNSCREEHQGSSA